jgi:hypothetical protein
MRGPDTNFARRQHRIESGRIAGRRNNWAAGSLSPDSCRAGWMPVTEEMGQIPPPRCIIDGLYHQRPPFQTPG